MHVRQEADTTMVKIQTNKLRWWKLECMMKKSLINKTWWWMFVTTMVKTRKYALASPSCFRYLDYLPLLYRPFIIVLSYFHCRGLVSLAFHHLTIYLSLFRTVCVRVYMRVRGCVCACVCVSRWPWRDLIYKKIVMLRT